MMGFSSTPFVLGDGVTFEPEELTLFDYATKPLIPLASHPDFNPNVMARVSKMIKMTTAQLDYFFSQMDSFEADV